MEKQRHPTFSCIILIILTFVQCHCHSVQSRDNNGLSGPDPLLGDPDGPDDANILEAAEVHRMNDPCDGEVCNHMADLSAWLQIIYHDMILVPSYEDFVNILTFGDYTFPILKAEDATILAAAQVGQGRVIGAGHTSYVTKFEELETTKLISGGDSSVRGDGGGRGCEVRADSTYTIPEHKACQNCWHSKDTPKKRSLHTRDTAGAACRDDVKGGNYQGTVSQTVGGLTCQNWSAHEPHSHSFTDITKFPDSSFAELKNYCRNPDDEKKPWCYTTTATRWDYCDTPLCPGVTQDCRNTEKGTEYMGTVSTTISDKTCQAWAKQSPHSHSFEGHSGFPDESFADLQNYCRNPDNEPSPWCYTTDPNKRWEFCDTPICPEGSLGQQYRLNENIKMWLSRGNYVDDANVCKLEDSSSMACLSDSSIHVVYWSGTGSWRPSDQDQTELLEWVQAGGGLLWGIQSWEWQDKSKPGLAGEPYSSIPFYNVIEEAGMAFTDTWFNTDAELPIPSSEDDIQELLHQNFEVTASKILSLDDVKKHSATIDRWINSVEDDITQQIYPSLMSKICEVMVPVGNRLEPVMPWPAGSVEDITAVRVTADHQKMYKVFYELGRCGKWNAPNVDKFPGDIAEPQETKSYIFEKTTRKWNQWSTGMYLLPGQEMTIEVLSSENDQYKEFQVLIGSHTDSLYHKEELRRFPLIKRYVALREPLRKVKHMHGGLIFVESWDKEEDHYVKIKLSGVIEAPYFNLADASSVADWLNRRNAPGLWADISGRNVRFTVPSSSVRDLEDLSEVMTIWDEVMEMNYVLKGTSVDKWIYQWAGIDIQISNGGLHSGYPIGAHLDKGDSTHINFVLRKENLIQQWGMFHEFGHNLQESPWTFDGTGEVTTNIFSLFQLWRLYGQDPLNDGMLSTVNWDKYDEYLSNMTYEGAFSTAWVPLIAYAQQASNFGWDCYHKVFSSYNDADTVLPQDDQQERDQWVQRWSEAVGYNLCPLWEFISLPMSENMCQSLKKYPPFLPDDIATQKPNAATLVSRIESRYPDLVRTVDTKPDCPARIQQSLINENKQQSREQQNERDIEQLLEELLEQIK